MATTEDNNRKRPSEVEDSTTTTTTTNTTNTTNTNTNTTNTATTRPPPKKRFLSSRSASPSHSSDGTPLTLDDNSQEDTIDTFKEPLEVYRRDAIIRQLKEYRRSYRQWKKRADLAEERRQDCERQLRVWDTQFKQLQAYMQGRILDHTPEYHPSFIKDSLSFDILLQDDWAVNITTTMANALRRGELTEDLMGALYNYSVPFSTKRMHFLGLLEPSGENSALRSKYKNALSSFTSNQSTLLDSINQYRSFNTKFILLTEELRLLTNRLELAESLLQETRLKLSKANDKLAAEKETSANFSNPTQPMDTSDAKDTASEGTTPPQILETQQDPLICAQQTLEKQLREIEEMKDQRIELKQQLFQLEVDYVVLPETRIYKDPLCRQALQTYDYQRDKNDHLTNVCQKLQKELEDSQSTRRQFLEELDTKQTGHIKGLEEQLRKLDGDLTRIRGHRDALQSNLEERKANTEFGRDSISELRVIGDVRKEQVFSLGVELSRLRLKGAAKSGSHDLYKFMMAIDEKKRTREVLEKELGEADTKIQATRARYLDPEALAILDDEFTLITKIKHVREQLDVFKETYGFEATHTDEKAILDILQAKVKSEQASIIEARQKMEALESTEHQLLSEIQSVTMAFGELEESNLAKIHELAVMEDEVTVLQGERVKYSQTFTALNKSKDAHAMVANALSKKVEKQLAYIKQLNEREKNLGNQITTLDRQSVASSGAVEIYLQKSLEMKASLEELKEKMLFGKEKIGELEKSVLEKIKMIEEDAHSRMRLEEGCELLRRKVEATTKVEKPVEMKLRKEKEEYRSLLNCSSCRTRLKSHVLMRCMHTFCKDCLDIRIETRQRRCPSCGESFGINDVKQFYL
ncbi:hypothetical protein F4703DRAFT_1866227 [Phycomyces blakesleeanus]